MKTKKIVLMVLLLFVIAVVFFIIILWKTDSFFVEKINFDFTRERTSIFTIGEGETFKPIGILARLVACKPGLNTVRNASNAGFGCGFSTWRSSENFVCVKCGNGVCGSGENICNCPKDCK
jgi:hypothetical protein